MKFAVLPLNYTLIGKEEIRTLRYIHISFSKRPALPMATFPLYRVKSASIRHLYLRQRYPLPIKLLTPFLRLAEFESAQLVWQTSSLPLTYNRYYIINYLFNYNFFIWLAEFESALFEWKSMILPLNYSHF